MKKIILIVVVIIGFCSCKPKENVKQENSQEVTMSTEQWGDFKKIDPEEISENVIQLIGKDWMLITAGNENSFNTMTASWGALGEIWGKPASFITVRDSRYTYQFLESNDYYTLCFFPEKYKEALTILGTKSGRDTEKIKESGLSTISTPVGSMAFNEAKIVIECRKLYAEPFKQEAFVDKDTYEQIYVKGEKSIHTLYIGEIINVWVR